MKCALRRRKKTLERIHAITRKLSFEFLIS
jgi:hypothetical protein